MNTPEETPPTYDINLTQDHVRLFGNGERVKAMVVMDITPLTEEQRTLFVNRALVALTRMAQKVMTRRTNNQN